MKKILPISFISAFIFFIAFPKDVLAAPLVGAIRWDAWTETWPNNQMQYFMPQEFRYRLPFYAYIKNGVVEMSEDKQGIINREINYAASAGISYWLFGWYEPNTVSKTGGFVNPLKQYLNSPNKDKINFALMFMDNSEGKKEDWETKTVPLFLSYVTEPTYQKIKIGGVERPMVFFYQPQALPGFFGSLQKAQDEIAFLRRRVKARTGQYPYLIGLSSVSHMSRLKELGFDAGSTYLVGMGPNGQPTPYTALLSNYQNYYQSIPSSSLPFITPAAIGLNDKPRALVRGHSIAAYVEEGSQAQITQMIHDAVAFSSRSSNNVITNSILVYAWNELSEGGWLMPGLTLGDKHLRALAAGIGHSFPRSLTTTVSRVGNNFKLKIDGTLPSGTYTVQFYDQGSILWGSRQTVSSAHSVTLPDLLPPSQCNSQGPCRLNADIYKNGVYYSFISFSLPKSAAPTTTPGDLNSDGKVDIFDYNILVAGYGTTYSIADYNNVVGNFGK